jgi:hypothetical protein
VVHLEAWQASAVGQTLPQAPQLAESELVSVQVPLQQIPWTPGLNVHSPPSDSAAQLAGIAGRTTQR